VALLALLADLLVNLRLDQLIKAVVALLTDLLGCAFSKYYSIVYKQPLT